MYYCRSLIKKRAKANKERSRKGVIAKERKRLEAPAPDYPVDRTWDYQEIIIRGMHLGQYREITYALLPVERGQGRIDQYALYGAGSHPLGVMGANRIMAEIGRREFVRVRAAD
jgi:hypothetical protein